MFLFNPTSLINNIQFNAQNRGHYGNLKAMAICLPSACCFGALKSRCGRAQSLSPGRWQHARAREVRCFLARCIVSGGAEPFSRSSCAPGCCVWTLPVDSGSQLRESEIALFWKLSLYQAATCAFKKTGLCVREIVTCPCWLDGECQAEVVFPRLSEASASPIPLAEGGHRLCWFSALDLLTNCAALGLHSQQDEDVL